MKKIISEINKNLKDMESTLKEEDASVLIQLFEVFTKENIDIIERRINELNDEYLKEMKKLKSEYDHVDADFLLCNLLEELGFTELTEVYRDLPKWFS